MKKTVLVVDDDADVRRLYAILLARRGYHVIERDSAEDLVPLVVAAEPVAVLIDLMMPIIDGLEAAALLRADPRTRDVRIVMISASASFEAARRASELNVERYLVKPVPAATVVAAIEGQTPVRRRLAS